MTNRTISMPFVVMLVLFAGCRTLEPNRDAVPASGLRFSAVFSDNMVLQHGMDIPVWGWADPGGRVTVSLGKRHASALVDDTGTWRVELSAMRVGGPYTMTVRGEKTLTLSNVMVGDVWICAGQSNMEMTLRPGPDAVLNAEQEVAAANYPGIRLFTVPPATSFTPKIDLEGAGWQVCSPDTVETFSAVGYFFGRDLYQRLHVPIGLVNASRGASPAEAWTSAEALRNLPDFQQAVEEFPEKVRQAVEALPEYEKAAAAWDAALDAHDMGYRDDRPVWADPAYDDTGWTRMELPTHWEDAGFPDLDGLMWFRREVELPGAWAGKRLSLGLGTINDMDRVWFNGVLVGRFEQLSGWTKPRVYEAPADAVHAGRNVIAVRVYDIGGKGGICGLAKDMWVKEADSSTSEPIPLAGSWRCRPGLDLRDIPPKPQPPAFVEGNQRIPTVLYNAMIAPLIPYGIRGVIWYQGESNVGRAVQYRTLFPAMIQDWRTRWGQGAFPFLFVQLAGFKPINPEPVESALAELREAQRMTLSASKTGMAVTIDIGDANNVHPRNKQEVGRRLALVARHTAYGENLTYCGPRYAGMEAEGGAIRVRFDHTDGGLTAANGLVKGFAIAGEDGRYVWADARIEGDTVVISSPRVPHPVTVRYAWSDNPVCNLRNKEGLPASPFRAVVDEPLRRPQGFRAAGSPVENENPGPVAH
jgi:sialate O-acetylesterase